MTMSDPTLVSDIARGIIEDVAPDELPMFGMASRAYLKNPTLVTAGGGAADEMLGFGGGEIEMLTPVIFSVTSAVVSFLLAAVVSAAKSETESVVKAQVRQMFKRLTPATATVAATPAAAAPIALTREQLIEVRRVAYDAAAGSGLPANQAALLADATVGQLAIAA